MRRIDALALFLFASTAIAQVEPPAPAAPADARRTDSGLASIVIQEPSGTTPPADEDFVTLDYTGWNASGAVIDSTAKHPDVKTFALAKLFPGLKEAIASMKAGEKRRVWIPESLTPKNVLLVFDVELIEITRPFTTPVDVASPPADAERSKSGLAWKVLRAGDGPGHPKRNSHVVVHYTGWTTDGKMFDSSYGRGEPASFQLDEVIPGWTEGLQKMTAGEKRRFWVPSKLAYRGQRGKPQGMLVFDVELLRFF